jgi:endoglycosylceramidase
MDPTIAQQLCTARIWQLSSLLVLLCAGCTTPPAFPLDSDGQHLRDSTGRAVILRGINARVDGVFDVTFDDGRAPLEPIPTFTDEDAAYMAELGFSLLRLPISWSAVEPSPGVFDDTYLDRVAAAVATARARGILTLIDFHEDAWSKEIGEDGAPLWAIEPPPTVLLGGPLTDLGTRRTSAQVLNAFATFFGDDPNDLQNAFADMAAHVAARFSDEAGVVGYEIFNEPLADDSLLLPFYIKVAKAIRAADAQHLIAFEPDVLRNYTESAPLATNSFAALSGVHGAIYAPHIYTAAFGDPSHLVAEDYVDTMAGSYVAARAEADSWQAALLVGEFGVDPTYPSWITHALDDADSVLASTAFWVWKEESQGSWGLFDHLTDGRWTPRLPVIAALSRPYARAIGGDPVAMTWDGERLTVRFTARPDVAPLHDIFWPNGLPSVSCDGDPVAPRPLPAPFWQIDCAGSTLIIF